MTIQTYFTYKHITHTNTQTHAIIILFIFICLVHLQMLYHEPASINSAYITQIWKFLTADRPSPV